MSRISFLVLLSIVPVWGAQTPPLRFVGTVPLPGIHGRIDHMAADIAGNRLFVAALANNSLEVLDVKRRVHLKTISGLAEPQGVGYLPGFARLFVANGSDGTVRVYDGTSLELLQTAQVGDDADNVRVGASRHRIFVAYGKGAIAALDNAGRILSNVALDAHPESFQIESLGPRIFVNVPNAQEIEIIDRDKHAVISKWPLTAARRNFPMALDEENKRLFVVCRVPATLLILDMNTGAVVAKLPSVGDADDVFYDRVRKRIYATGGAGAIVVYQEEDPDHYQRIARVATARGARTSLYCPDWNELFVAVPAGAGKRAEIRVFKAQP